MNAVSHCNRPRASSCAMIARQIRSHVPSSSQRFNRRQHVDGLGYSAGRSRHRAPVFSTQRMPSTTARWLAQGRPPRGERGGRGRSGSMWAHCASVNRTPRLATCTTSGQGSTKSTREVQALSEGYETASRHHQFPGSASQLTVNATHVVHSEGSGNNGGYHTNPLALEGLPNESPS